LFTSKKTNIAREKFHEIIDECAELNVPVVCLIGGEPLLYKHLNELICRIDSHGMMSIIATNGSLLTEERVRELAGCGLTNVTISLLSLDEATHDRMMRLDGVYRQAFKARDYCREYGVTFQLATVLRHADFENGAFDHYVEFAERERTFLSINPIIPTGYAIDKQEELLTSDDVRRLNEVSRKSLYVSTHLTNNYFGFGCPAGNAYVGVNASGELLPCFFIPVSLGNVNQVSLKEAWEKACSSPLFCKKHKMCYAGTSREFVCNYLEPIFEADQVPMPIEDHPRFEPSLAGLPDLAIADVEAAAEYSPRREEG
jgi:MoaA/NifB/PqqE/SkfB family radical SAM enzyme